MGVDTNINIGPYLLVTTKKSAVTVKVWSCTNTVCKKHKKETEGAFCSVCGTKNSKVSVEQITDVSPYEVLGSEFEDSLCTADSMGSPLHGLKKNQEILVSNSHNPFDKNGLDLEQGGVTDLENKNIKDEKDWFYKKHAVEIALLEHAYGEKNVELKYGIVVSFS